MPEFNSSAATSARGGSFGGQRVGSATQVTREPTKEEAYALQDSINENKRKGFYKRIFPTVDFLYYKQFFEEDRPLNRFLDEKLMGKKRDNTHQARIMNQKMPIFLQTNQYGSALKPNKMGVAPPSGIDRNSAVGKSYASGEEKKSAVKGVESDFKNNQMDHVSASIAQ